MLKWVSDGSHALPVSTYINSEQETVRDKRVKKTYVGLLDDISTIDVQAQKSSIRRGEVSYYDGSQKGRLGLSEFICSWFRGYV